MVRGVAVRGMDCLHVVRLGCLLLTHVLTHVPPRSHTFPHTPYAGETSVLQGLVGLEPVTIVADTRVELLTIHVNQMPKDIKSDMMSEGTSGCQGGHTSNMNVWTSTRSSPFLTTRVRRSSAYNG